MGKQGNPIGVGGAEQQEEALLQLVRLLARAAAAEYVRSRAVDETTPSRDVEERL